MPRQKNDAEELKRVHVWLFAEDVEAIHRIYGAKLGFSRALRLIVHKNVREFLAKADQATTPLPPVSIDPSDLED